MPRFVVVMTSHERTRFSYYATCSHREHFKTSCASVTTSKRICVVSELDTNTNLMSSQFDNIFASFVLLVPSSNHADTGEHAG